MLTCPYSIVKRCTIKLCTTKKSVTIGCLDLKNMSKLRITTPNSTSWNRHSSGYLILQYMSVWNSSKATHIYTVSITYFVLKFYERFFKTRSIIHTTGTNIYIYTRTCVYRIIWRCSETYSWIYWRMKEIDIGEFFLPI